jgi:hypothetical protein
MLQAFIDDSSSNSRLVLSGYLAPVSAWERFDIEWQQILDASPKMRRLKMASIYNELGKEEADKRLILFREVIEKYAALAVTFSVDIDAYKKVQSESKYSVLKTPYYVLMFDLIVNLSRYVIGSKISDKIEFIFDTQTPESEHIYYAWKNIGRARPDIAEFIGTTPKFEKDEEMLPLQAADLIAWWRRRHMMEMMSHGDVRTFPPWKEKRTIPEIRGELGESELRAAMND